MKQVFRLLTFVSLCCSLSAAAQVLHPGFDKQEYIELLKMNGCQSDTMYPNAVFQPTHFDRIYRSKVVGLLNRWDLWVNKEKTIAGISLRASVGESLSWLGNFFSGMLPAEDSIRLNKKEVFHYCLSHDKMAAVHAGWTIGTAAMAADIIQKVDSCYKSGIKSFYIVGHSQGGAIAYLLASQLLIMRQDGKLPADIQFKTYCSAAPKPGNLYYAYNFEALTQGGWAFNIVNSEDWVPQMPVSVQTGDDFPATSPFTDILKKLSAMKFPIDMVLKSAYRDMSGSLNKSRHKLQKYLGKKAGKIVQKSKPQLQLPPFYLSEQYVRTGQTVVLYPTEAYYKEFPKANPEDLFSHHSLEAYLFLAKLLPE